jgi:hypothetical protein
MFAGAAPNSWHVCMQRVEDRIFYSLKISVFLSLFEIFYNWPNVFNVESKFID